MSASSSLNEKSSYEEGSDPTSTAEQFDVEEEENSTSSSNHQSNSDIEAPPPIFQSSNDFTSDQITTANSITPIALDKSLSADAAVLNDSGVLHKPPAELVKEKSVINLFLHLKFWIISKFITLITA